MNNFKYWMLVLVFIFSTQKSFAQSKPNWILSSGVGIGIIDEKSSFNFNTNIAIEKFISKRFSLGLCINHLSTFNYSKENKDIYIDKDEIEYIDQLDNFTATLFSATIMINYYVFLPKNQTINFGIGPAFNFYNRHRIVFSPSPYAGKSKILIYLKDKIYSFLQQPMIALNAEYTYFINDKTGFNFKIFATNSYGFVYALVGGIKIEL